MASWASIARAAAPPPAAVEEASASTVGLRLLVVDANAIIGGVRLEGVADRAVTVQEVADEIRDKQSRAFLAALPYSLAIREPTEESVKFVTRFARETGDIAALSTTDIKLLALAHTLEAAAHGTAHLATHAAAPRMHKRGGPAQGALPGWGRVSNPEDWRAVDEADDSAGTAGPASRIATHVQQLSLDPLQPAPLLQEDSAASGAAAAAAAAAKAMQQQQQRQEKLSSAAAAATAAAAAPVAPVTPQPPVRVPAAAAAGLPSTAAAAVQPHDDRHEDASNKDDDGDDGDDGGGGDWEVAASSAMAARRRRRKQHRHAARQQAFEAEWEEHSRLMEQARAEAAAHAASSAANGTPQLQQQQQQRLADQDELKLQQQQQQQVQPQGPEAQLADSNCSSDSDGSSDAAEDAEGEELTPDEVAELLAAEHSVITLDECAEGAGDGASDADADADAVNDGDDDAPAAPGQPGWQSSVAMVSADFAMQNVALQAGLRLLTRDGRLIARLARYALRCGACFNVTREPGRLFCPKCGNMGLDRVEVVVGPNGAEYYGVRKRHILRGTRYSLPKPRGGRSRTDPVLREDVFLLKVKALNRRPGRRPKPAAAAADGGADGAEGCGVDPFAPEYGDQTWHTRSQAELAAHRGLAAVLQPSWKRNPNDRKPTRSSRRG